MSPVRVSEQRLLANPDSRQLFMHVLYDTPVMQSAAAIVCDQLGASFQADLQVQVLWSHFQHLADQRYSLEAAEVAAQSDVVIVATVCHDALPGTVARWLGSWICQHHKPDTMLCGLFTQRLDHEPFLPPIAALLEATAKLTGREWLTGWVRRPVEAVRPPTRPVRAGGSHTALFHTPLCHGING